MERIMDKSASRRGPAVQGSGVGWTVDEYTPAVGRLHARVLDLQDVLEAFYTMAVSGVVCDPHHRPCPQCADIFERVRELLDGDEPKSAAPVVHKQDQP